MPVNGQVVVRPMMYVALSYDHRIVDGREAVQFLVKIKELHRGPRPSAAGELMCHVRCDVFACRPAIVIAASRRSAGRRSCRRLRRRRTRPRRRPTPRRARPA